MIPIAKLNKYLSSSLAGFTLAQVAWQDDMANQGRGIDFLNKD